MKTTIKSFMGTIFTVMMATSLLLAISCSKDGVTDLTQENLTATSAKGGKAVTRPISITLSGADDQDGVGGTFTGKMAHLGKIYGTVAPGDFLPIGVNTFSFDTQAGLLDVIFAANGDELYSTGSLTFVQISESEFTYSGTITFHGGTGRFADASGYMEINDGVYVITGFSDISTFIGEFSHTGHGSITY